MSAIGTVTAKPTSNMAHSPIHWIRLLLLLLITVSTAAATITTTPPPSNRTIFDYVIVGGGTAGLAVANRLSADPSVSVAVIEAGASARGDARVLNTTRFGLGLGTELDWAYPTAPQRYARNESQTYHAGKALGGSTVINGMTYLRAQRAQLDAWETALNNSGGGGWNWATLSRCYRNSERFQPPSPAQAADGAAFDAAVHGTAGPVRVGWQETAPLNGSGTAIIAQTWANVGVQTRRDANGGAMQGFSVWPLTVDARTSTRVDAATAYLWPVQGRRSNLVVFVNTTARRVLWRDEEKGARGGKAWARGVEVTTADGRVGVVGAKREVILAAGSLRSPALLEYSGVGNPACVKRPPARTHPHNPLPVNSNTPDSILSTHSIPVKIALPGVGENLQDQTNVALSASLLPSSSSLFAGYPPYVTYLTLHDLFHNSTSLAAFKRSAYAALPAMAAANVVANPANGTTLAAQTTLLTAQMDLLFANPATLPVVEVLTAISGGFGVASAPAWASLPFARGSVHVAAPLAHNSSPTPSLAINPNFLLHPLDTQLQTLAVRAALTLLSTPPLSAHVNASSLPLAPAANKSLVAEFVRAAYAPNAHPLGTAALLPRAVGGVVDAALRVYGTGNVRVVDASVLPWQVAGHLASTVYAVAERAAEIILGEGEAAAGGED